MNWWHSPRNRTVFWALMASLIALWALWALYRQGEPWWWAWGLGAMALFVLLGAGWLFFFAQFVLPLRTWQERRMAFRRLWQYVMGIHGPVLFVQDGQVLRRQGEQRRQGPGVIVLDTASAAVLGTPYRFTRAVGPGVTFTAAGETIRDTLDLRLLSRLLGPRLTEDPFAPQGEREGDEAYRERQRRRAETSGMTRDGIEVVPTIVAVFYLDDHPDGLSPAQLAAGRFATNFYGHQESAWRAVTRRVVDADAQQEGGAPNWLPWDWLPPYLAADLWKTYIQRFTLDQLFMRADARREPEAGRVTALARILGVMRTRLTQPYYEELDPFGEATGARLPSPEYRLLQERGLRVQTVALVRLAFPPEVEQRLAEHWSATWYERAVRERELIEREHAAQRHRGERQALQTLLWPFWSEDDGAAMRLPDWPATSLGRRQAMAWLVGRWLTLFDNPEVHRELEMEEQRLRDLLHWLAHQDEIPGEGG